MENSLKIQMDIKNNTLDLQNYMLDLNNWECEMKKKEMELTNEKPFDNNIPPLRNKIKRNKPENEKSNFNKPKKILAYDYSAWDKFDADKACSELDEQDCLKENSKQEQQNKIESFKNVETLRESDNFHANEKLSLVDEAFYEKERGNQFVKKELWNEAIKCYTNAINLDSKNAIYYANRSLCLLKLKNFKSAEVDATVAVQLDKFYVKAYQRRAFARLALGQLKEAKSDYEEVLKIEPKNTLAKIEINKINEKLNKELKINKTVSEKSKFDQKTLKSNKIENNTKTFENVNFCTKSSDLQQLSELKNNNLQEINTNRKIINKTEVCLKNEELELEIGSGDKSILVKSNRKKFNPLPKCCIIINPINVPAHKRSKKFLRKIIIKEVDKDYEINFQKVPVNLFSNFDLTKEEKKIVNKQQDDCFKKEKLLFKAPTTSIHFQNCWKIIKNNPQESYLYLKKISGNKLPQIFENSLESDFFSELITFLANDDIKKDPEFIYDFLLGLSNVKRFSSLILFMSKNDKACVKKCISIAEKVKSKNEIHELFCLYEL